MTTKSTDAKLLVQVRWKIRRDLKECLFIENSSFEYPWSEEDFLCVLRQKNAIAMVAESRETIVGFMDYELQKSQIHVLNFAVHPAYRHQGVGQQMVEKLVNKLSQQRRQEITLEIRETNLAAQLFFSRMGFKAEKVIRGHYDDTTEDAYRFSYQMKSSECCDPVRGNRRF